MSELSEAFGVTRLDEDTLRVMESAAESLLAAMLDEARDRSWTADENLAPAVIHWGDVRKNVPVLAAKLRKALA